MPQEQANPQPKKLRTIIGKVVAFSGKDTISVQVERQMKHPQYNKYIRRRRNLAVHDTQGEAQIGDMVEIVPCRPLSKRKAHRLARVLRHTVMER